VSDQNAVYPIYVPESRLSLRSEWLRCIVVYSKTLTQRIQTDIVDNNSQTAADLAADASVAVLFQVWLGSTGAKL
jgi:hypothetical protein